MNPSPNSPLSLSLSLPTPGTVAIQLEQADGQMAHVYFTPEMARHVGAELVRAAIHAEASR